MATIGGARSVVWMAIVFGSDVCKNGFRDAERFISANDGKSRSSCGIAYLGVKDIMAWMVQGRC